jgi:hypothetical protein
MEGKPKKKEGEDLEMASKKQKTLFSFFKKDDGGNSKPSTETPKKVSASSVTPASNSTSVTSKKRDITLVNLVDDEQDVNVKKARKDEQSPEKLNASIVNKRIGELE